MTELTSKKIILGIGGGIAAYKAPEIVRRLRELGAEVRVVMTSAAKAFITPLSLQVVSSNYVANEMLDQSYQAAMKHIQLAKWADFVILAPATADLLARLAAGFANDLLSAICLATPATIAAVPAMNQHMYLAAATQANLTTLRKRGILLWGPDNGSQACGDIGLGRMLDPLVLVEQDVRAGETDKAEAPYRDSLTPHSSSTVHSLDQSMIPIRQTTHANSSESLTLGLRFNSNQ
ncbi:hypothetical protein J6590_018688 [Homalodisca vitripennis]|nr:hypothetical protein J6590_018688 [Homalodisca vitripennis]